MSENKSKFNIEELVKKIESGDLSLLVVAGFVMIVPVIAILILTNGPKGGKRISQEKMRSMVHRKNVFNFGTADKNGKSSIPSGGMRSGSSSGSSGWFSSARSPEQIVNDQLEAAMKKLERDTKVIAPSYLEGDNKLFYEAEKNYYLCMANGLFEEGRYNEAEEYLKNALAYNSDNPFLVVNVYALLADVYEKLGDDKKREEAAKKFIDAYDKLPGDFVERHMKADVRNAYKAMESMSKYADPSKISESYSKTGSNENGVYPDKALLENITKSFPIKFD